MDRHTGARRSGHWRRHALRIQRRVFWDISWIWGPPEDHLAKLFRTVGSSRFVFGSQWPLRLVQTPRANLDLLPDETRGAELAFASTICRAAARRD